MFDYAGLAISLHADFNEFGQRAYLRKAAAPTGTAYDPTVGNPRDWPVTVIDNRKAVRDRDGALVESSGHSIKMSTEGLDFVTPEKSDTIMMGPIPFPEKMTEFEIAEVRPKSPGGVVVVYDIDLVR